MEISVDSKQTIVRYLCESAKVIANRLEKNRYDDHLFQELRKINRAYYEIMGDDMPVYLNYLQRNDRFYSIHSF